MSLRRLLCWMGFHTYRQQRVIGLGYERWCVHCRRRWVGDPSCSSWMLVEYADWSAPEER